MFLPVSCGFAMIRIVTFGFWVGNIGRSMISLTLVLTSVCIACLEIQPWGEVHGQGNIGCGMIFFVGRFFIMLVSHNITVTGQIVKVT